MANGGKPSQGLLQEAEHIGHEQPALLADLSARLFPRSPITLDDATVASARAILFSLCSQIESDLSGERATLSWPVIERSRLLDDPALLAFLMAQAAHLRLAPRVTSIDMRRSTAWLAGFAARDDTLVGRSANDLLAARSRTAAERLSGRYDLPAPLFRLVTVQVEAALQSLGVGHDHRPAMSRDLCAAHDEAQGLPHIATRLALQLAAEGAFGQLRDVRAVGIDLFAGSLAAELDCSWHDVVRILGEGGPRLVLLLRAADFSLKEATGLIALLEPGASPRALFHYGELSKAAAMRLLPGRLKSDDEASNDA